MARHVFAQIHVFALHRTSTARVGLAARKASAADQVRAGRSLADREAASKPGRAARHAGPAVLGLLALLLALPVTRAQASAFTPEAHCADVASLVSQAGGAILETAPETFHRFVRDNSFCDPDGVARPAFVPTQDNPACFVGYKCSNYPAR